MEKWKKWIIDGENQLDNVNKSDDENNSDRYSVSYFCF